MKVNLNPKSRLIAATKILSRLGVELNVKSVSSEITKARVQELEVLGAEEAQALAEVLGHLDAFDDVVREQVKEMRTAERYEIVRNNFKTILDDAERMVNQVNDDGKVSFTGKMQNRFMKWRRGSIQSRFQELRNVSEQVFADVNDQIQREVTILEAYREFRTGLKEATIVGQVLLERAEARKNEYAEVVKNAQQKIDDARANGAGLVEVGSLELARDAAQTDFDREDRRYQSAIDLSEQLTIAYGISEAVMEKLAQTTEIKDAQQRKTATFYTANRGTLTALTAAFTAIKGMHEQTQTHKALVDGTNDAIGRLANLGTKAQQNAMEATYGATLDAQNLKKLFESAVQFEETQRTMIESLREKSKKNDAEIRKVIEDGQRRLAEAVSKRRGTTSGLSVASQEVHVAEPVGIELEVAPVSKQALKAMQAESSIEAPATSQPSASKPF